MNKKFKVMRVLNDYEDGYFGLTLYTDDAKAFYLVVTDLTDGKSKAEKYFSAIDAAKAFNDTVDYLNFADAA